MKNIIYKFILQLCLLVPTLSLSATIDLAEKPLNDTGTQQVLPNIMYIFDNSGSMYWDYAPDYVSNQGGTASAICRDSGDDDDTVTAGINSLDVCHIGLPPYMSPDINGQYYNPENYYKPPVDANNSSRPDQTDPTNVLTDGVGVGAGRQPYTQLHSPWTSGSYTNITNSVDLTTNYPDLVFCNKRSPSTAELSDTTVCRANNDYTYPDATFRYSRLNKSYLQLAVASTANNSTLNIVGGAPYYYRVVPTEFCTAADLKNCIASTVATTTHPVPARDRWCKDKGLTNCQAQKNEDDPLTVSVADDGYQYPRYIGAQSTGQSAQGGFTISSVNRGNNRTLNYVNVNGVDITCGGFTSNFTNRRSNRRRRDYADAVVNSINSCNTTPNYTAIRNGFDVDIFAVLPGTASNGTLTALSGTSVTLNNQASLTGGQNPATIAPYVFQRTNIVPGATFPRAPNRTDCGAGATCTYAQEVTNFGNWYAYYRTRMQSMKSSTSLAFASIDDKYRVGFVTLNRTQYLSIDKFSTDSAGTGQKDNWYNELFLSHPRDGNGTPLRSALSWVGRNFAGQVGTDPVQFACQSNYAMVTTDGYWNVDTAATVRGLTGASVGNQDDNSPKPTPTPKFEGAGGNYEVSNSLADVSRYFHDNDLRTTALRNCPGAGGNQVCGDLPSDSPDDKFQNMVTFTIGLGVDGSLLYDPNYKTATTGDFSLIQSGAIGWPRPSSGSQNNIDDLWHAAVNGEGTYFSAKNPKALRDSLGKALSEINVKVRSGSGSGASTLQPVVGKSLSYVGSYIPSRWTGNLEARRIDSQLKISKNALWCVEDVAQGTCDEDEVLVSSPNSGNGSYCKSTATSAAACSTRGGVLGTTLGGSGTAGECYVLMPTACVGKLKSQVTDAGDTRKIYFNSGAAVSPTRSSFIYDNLKATDKAFYTSEFDRIVSLNNPTVSPTVIDPADTTRADQLVKYLRGATGFYDTTANPDLDKRLFRKREAILGDITYSKSAYYKAPVFNFNDPGYAAFKTGASSNPERVYVGVNDGMLHAFDASDNVANGGKEKWTFIPTPVLKKMTKLAENNYLNNHQSYVEGSPVISNVCKSPCAGATDWRTILVGGLNGGGRGYYALDITNADNPILLWEFIASAGNANLGYTFGKPLITKKLDGTWVVVVTSGYNNGSYAKGTTTQNPAGNGQGYLYVLDALSGTKLTTIGTGVGTATNPSGLSKISGFARDSFRDNTSENIYGGDLYGNLWRFDINQPQGANNPFRLLKLGATQPITIAPALGLIAQKPVVFIGTGKYLEQSDLTDSNKQSIYAIRGDRNTPLPAGTKGIESLIKQTISGSAGKRSVTVNSAPVDFSSINGGWKVDFPLGEKVNVDPLLVEGVLAVASIVPQSTTCDGGGYGWFNFFDYKTGGSPVPGTTVMGQKTNSPITDMSLSYGPDGVVISGSTTNSLEGEQSDIKIKGESARSTIFEKNNDGSYGRRSTWRELIKE